MRKRILKSNLIKENEELKNKLKEILKKEYDEIINVDYDDEFDAFLDDDILNNIINKYNVSFKYLETYKYKGEYNGTYNGEKLNFSEYDFYIYKLKFNDEYKKYNMINVIEYLLNDYYSYDYKDMMDKKETLIMIEKEKNKEYFLIIQKDPFLDLYYGDFDNYASDVLTFINRLLNINTYYYLCNFILNDKDNKEEIDNKYKILYFSQEYINELINKFNGLFEIINTYKEK